MNISSHLIKYILIWLMASVCLPLYAIDTIDIQWIKPKKIYNVKILDVKYPKFTKAGTKVDIKVQIKNYSDKPAVVKLELEIDANDIAKRDLVITPPFKIKPLEVKNYDIYWVAKTGKHTFEVRALDLEDVLFDKVADLRIEAAPIAVAKREKAEENTYLQTPYTGVTGVNPYTQYYSALASSGGSSTSNNVSYTLSPVIAPTTAGYNPFFGIDVSTVSAASSGAGSIVSSGSGAQDSLLFGLNDFTGSEPTGLDTDIIVSYKESMGFYSGGGGRGLFSSQSSGQPLFFNEDTKDFDFPPPNPLGDGDYPIGDVPEPSTMFGGVFSLLFAWYYYKLKKNA